MAKLSFMNVIFEYKASDLTQYYRIQYFDKNNREIKNPEIPYGLKSSGIIVENEFWPKGWETKGLLHKASCFSPKHNEFRYYYSDDKATHYIIENSLSNNDWIHSWKYTKLYDRTFWKNVANGFWWVKKAECYFSLEPKEEEFRRGKILYFTKIEPSYNQTWERRWYQVRISSF
jgi:hypothetical protein